MRPVQLHSPAKFSFCRGVNRAGPGTLRGCTVGCIEQTIVNAFSGNEAARDGGAGANQRKNAIRWNRSRERAVSHLNALAMAQIRGGVGII